MERNENEVVVGIPLPRLPVIVEANGVDENGNVIPEAQIIRREADAEMPCSQKVKAKITVLFCVIETFMSSMFAWIYLSATDASAPQTFAWKHMNQFFYITISNSSEKCQKFEKSIPVHSSSGIRPFLNPKDHCVIDKSATICSAVAINNYWFAVPLVPLITFVMPIVLAVLTAIYVFGNQRIRPNALSKLLCPMYSICVINPLVFIFGWTKQFLQLVIGEGVKGDMLYGYDLMMSPNRISTQWELTQIHSECCGFHSYVDWNVTGSGGRYPMSCCNTNLHQCTSPPTQQQVWKNGCFAEERNNFSFLTGITVLLLLFKAVVESVFFLLVIDGKPPDMQETSLVQCRDFNARAFGLFDITDVVTDNRVLVRVRNFRVNLHIPVIERTYRYVELYVRSRGVILGSVHIVPLNGLTLEDIVIHQDQGYRGIFEITTNAENPALATD